MSDTPRVDEFVDGMTPIALPNLKRAEAIMIGGNVRDAVVAWAEFARTLERELNRRSPDKAGVMVPVEEITLLWAVLTQAQLTLLVSIKRPDKLPESLGALNLACKACYDYRTQQVAALAAAQDRE